MLTVNERKKASKQVIIDDKVFKSTDKKWTTSIALTKNDFAENILNDIENFNDFNFSNFKLIFDVIKDIVEEL